MEFGDKVMVTYKNGDQFVGRIKDETEKMWVIEFDNNDVRKIKNNESVALGNSNLSLVRKTMKIEIVDDPKTPEVETPEVETPEVETPEVETPEVETPKVTHKNVDGSFGKVEFKTNKRVRRNNVFVLFGVLAAIALLGFIIVTVLI